MPKSKQKPVVPLLTDNPFCCYCCGENVGESFCLVALADNTSRPFVMHLEHAKRAIDAVFIMQVKKEDAV